MIFSTLINISLFFIFVITFGYNCLRNFVVKKKINNINKNDKNKYLYYRELLKELSIEELGYLFNGKKDVNLYIAVSLIKLKKINNVQLYNDDKNLKVLVENNLFKKGYIKELNYDKYLKEILSKKDITASEKFILSNLKNIDKDYFKKEYISIIEKNLNLKGYIEKYESTKMELFSISLGVISFIIYFISVLINNGDNDILNLFITIIISCLFFIMSIIISYMNKFYIKTKKGKDVYLKLLALKRYIHDFGKFDDRELEEIKLWDEWILYAIILNESDNLTKDLKEEYKNIMDGINDNS